MDNHSPDRKNIRYCYFNKTFAKDLLSGLTWTKRVWNVFEYGKAPIK